MKIFTSKVWDIDDFLWSERPSRMEFKSVDEAMVLFEEILLDDEYEEVEIDVFDKAGRKEDRHDT